MTKLKLILYSLAVAMLMPFSSCKDEDLNPVLEPETAVHGLGELQAGSIANFKFGDNNSTINAQLQWISIDRLNTVTKIDLFVEWQEAYIDDEGNPQIANHGTKKIKVIEGGAVPANRTNVAFSVSAKDLFEVFKDAKFDYGDGKGIVSVFNNTFKPDRSASAYFIPDDSFTLTWAFTTADGRYFDSWSDSVCSEFPGANCDIKWGVVCESNIAGTYEAVVTNATSTDPCCPTVTNITSTVVLTDKGSGNYEISDYSFGLYLEWYDVYGVVPNDPGLKTTVKDVCNKFQLDVADYFSASFRVKATGTINPAAGVIVLKWENDYGDKADIVLTKK